MITVTVKYPNKTITKEFPSQKEAEKYLCGLKGTFVGYTDNQTFAVAKL